ncbi:MAG TPA: hypothetical protein VGC65_02815 [Bacteroidia bacterium]|jgi:hypothetical protein
MKKILTSILFTLSIFLLNNIKAQTTHPFELGFNLGASWQQSDVKMKKLGGGGGFTFGQMYGQNQTNALDWGWRFRYLNAVNYGQDNKKSMGVAYNPVLNGMYNDSLNYNSTGGNVYQNHKTTLNEMSLELVIGANRMRNNTKFYPYVFGGLGITKALVLTNQLDDNNRIYNYNSIDSTGTANSSTITSSLNGMYDGSYETTAEGSETPRWKFMPSVGLGLGYQVTPGFSIGLEHKMTWALHDGLDGQQWSNDNTVSPTKDKYHYSSVWLKFSFGRKEKPATTTTNTVTPVDPVTLTPSGDRPSIVFTNPSASPYTSPQKSYTVKATIKNVNSKSDIGLIYNGVSNTNFNYDAVSDQFSFPLLLDNGSNTFMITATNANGSVTDNATVIFDQPIVVPPPTPAPVVTINTPSTNPFSTVMSNTSIVATALNVTSQSQIGVSINGVATSSFLFNPSTHIVNVSSNLIAGANTFVISAVNSAGSDSKSITVIYNMPAATPPPVITFVNPAVNPFTSSATPLPINAVVQHVTSISQISVTNNGAQAPTSALSFNPASGQLSFNANLIAGANTVTISATNVAGADSKSITIIYTLPVASIPAPVVSISSPTVNPFTSPAAIAPLNAVVLNVSTPSQIAVSINGVPTSAFTYNVSTKQLSMNISLVAGANVVTITANNSAGSDSKSQTIIYSQPAATPPPVVTITSPATNPFNTNMGTALVNATVLNVSSSSQIAVSVNGAPFSAFSYNMASKQLTLNAPLIAGANVITIAASTISGSDSKSVTIIYTQAAATPPPVVSITSPAVSPFTSTVNTATVNATILNVTTLSQVSVVVNGAATSAFTFNTIAGNSQVSLNTALISGANVIAISATNASGSDSKTTTILYSPVPVGNSPVVNIAVPTANPFTTSVNPCIVKASVLNVTGSSQIAVSVNGTPTTSFTYNGVSKQVALNVTLVAGANVVTITGTNPSGSDSKTTTIIYTMPVVAIPAPVVTITSPTVNPFNSSVSSATINATVVNVSAAAQIAVSVNGIASTAFSYNNVSKQLSLTTGLAVGANVITITATNASGSDSKTTTVIYAEPVASVPAPVVTITMPTTNPFNTSTSSATVSANVLNVTSASQIAVSINGVPTTAFAYNAVSKKLSLTTSLIVGANVFTITATNASGSDSKSTSVFYTAPLAPVVTISSPVTGMVTNLLAYPVEGTVLNVTGSSQISVKINGVSTTAFTYSVSTKIISFNVPLTEGANTILVSATTPGGSDSKTIVISYIAPPPLDTMRNPPGRGTSATSIGGALAPVKIVFGYSNLYTTNVAVLSVSAVVSNVAAQSDIVVKVNGLVVPFTYAVKTATFSANLNMGTNTITITGTNAVGSKTETLTVIRN